MVFRWLLCALLALPSTASLAAAPTGKPLVYCAGAGPEGFDPSLFDMPIRNDVRAS